MFQKYSEYIKDNPEGLWFKRKLYGWGWTPVKWQGWAVIFGYVAVIMLIFKDVDKSSHSVSDTIIGTAAPYVIATIVLIYICYKKGESPRWQWGKPKNEI